MNELNDLNIKVTTKITDLGNKIIRFLKTGSYDLKQYIVNSFDSLIFKISSTLTAQTIEITTAGEGFYTLTILPVLMSMNRGKVEIVSATPSISGTVAKIAIEVEN